MELVPYKTDFAVEQNTFNLEKKHVQSTERKKHALTHYFERWFFISFYQMAYRAVVPTNNIIIEIKEYMYRRRKKERGLERHMRGQHCELSFAFPYYV